MRSALFSAENLEKESDQPGMRLQRSFVSTTPYSPGAEIAVWT